MFIHILNQFDTTKLKFTGICLIKNALHIREYVKIKYSFNLWIKTNTNSDGYSVRDTTSLQRTALNL